MANMSTHVQRAWDRLLARTTAPTLASVAAFDDWIATDLPSVSSLLRLGEAVGTTVPIHQAAVSRAEWLRRRSAWGATPPSFDPIRIRRWAQEELCRLVVFSDPFDACDEDQCELELWWHEEAGEAVYQCEWGHLFVWKRRLHEGHAGRRGHAPLCPWTGSAEPLHPATRAQVSPLYPEVELLE